MRDHALATLAAALLLGGCATNIQQPADGNKPSTQPLGRFSQVMIQPMTNNTPDAFPDRASDYVRQELALCLSNIYQKVTLSEAGGEITAETLVVSPTILDGKKVNGAQRFFFGAMAGSSAALMQVALKDGGSNEQLAAPIVYSKGSAMAGAWTFGATDNAMLSDLAQKTCSYVAVNK